MDSSLKDVDSEKVSKGNLASSNQNNDENISDHEETNKFKKRKSKSNIEWMNQLSLKKRKWYLIYPDNK